jgi:hypothetical protein
MKLVRSGQNEKATASRALFCSGIDYYRGA